MKLLKTTISKTKYFLLALLVAFSFSCSPEDGENGMDGQDGAIGLTGPAGLNGTDGADGTNGSDGSDGSDGTDGTDGTDGNANVQTFIHDTSSFSGTEISLDIPQITQDVIDNDVIISYIFNGLNYYQVPGGGPGAMYVTRSWFRVGYFYIPFHNWDGTPYTISAGTVDSVKVILVESTSTTSGRTTNSKQQIYNDLNQAGVDITDYYAVCDYYGIDY